MLTAALDGLIDALRPGRRAPRRGRRAAPCSSTPATSTSPASACSARRLAPETPAYDVQQACGTGLEAAILVANKIALGQIDVGIAGGVDTTSDAPIALNEELRDDAAARPTARARRRASCARWRGCARGTSCPRSRATRSRAPASRWASTCAIMAAEWEIGRAEQDELALRSHRNLAAAYERGFSGRPGHPLPRAGARPEPARGLHAGEAGEAEAGLRRPGGDDDRRQLDAARRRRLGGAARQRGVGAASTACRCSPTSPTAQTAAVDHVHKREGLLMAPAYAMPRMLDRAGLDAAGLRPTTRSTRPSPPRCSARWPPGRTSASARSGSGCERAARRDRPRRSSTSTAARSPPATRSRRPAGGSSPGSPRRCTSAAADAA